MECSPALRLHSNDHAADNPSALTNDQYLEVLACVFQMNGSPSGPAALGVRQLQDIRMPAPGRAQRDANQ